MIQYSECSKMAAIAVANNGLQILSRPKFASEIAETVKDKTFIYYFDKNGECVIDVVALPYGNDFPIIGKYSERNIDREVSE